MTLVKNQIKDIAELIYDETGVFLSSKILRKLSLEDFLTFMHDNDIQIILGDLDFNFIINTIINTLFGDIDLTDGVLVINVFSSNNCHSAILVNKGEINECSVCKDGCQQCG